MLVETQTPLTHGDRTFFVGIAIALAMTVFLGFAPSYYLKSLTETSRYPTGVSVSPSLAPLIHVHALVFSTWILLFVTQSTLVAAGRTDIHRRLGVFSALLAPVMIVLGIMVSVRGARDGWNPGGPYPDSLAFMIVGLADMFVFSVFVGAGFYYRGSPEVHKRLMVLGTVGGLVWPAITRMPYVAGRPILMFGLLAALVLASAARDQLLHLWAHRVSLWGGLLVLATFPIRVAIGRTDVWHTVVAWLIR